MNEQEFRAEVIKGLNPRQVIRFLKGREKYNNDPATIDYDYEIEQEKDDIVIYKRMKKVIKTYEK